MIYFLQYHIIIYRSKKSRLYLYNINLNELINRSFIISNKEIQREREIEL